MKAGHFSTVPHEAKPKEKNNTNKINLILFITWNLVKSTNLASSCPNQKKVNLFQNSQTDGKRTWIDTGPTSKN
tara:strand:+ start:31 stop:252 length:222 start_codon:yes stop_codon:yes gene_type:complete